jgi:hypothetical protein
VQTKERETFMSKDSSAFQATALQATFSSFRLVQGRKVAQLIFEVPIEAADNALSALGGVPNPAEERWVGIARIIPQKKKPSLSGKDIWRASSECAMLCKEPKFWAFLTKCYRWECRKEDEAIVIVRTILGVDSRSDMDHNAEAARKWGAMRAHYENWKTNDNSAPEI